MILLALLLVPFAGGVLAWAAETVSPLAVRWTALCAAALELVVAAVAWFAYPAPAAGWPPWVAQFQAEWVPQLGISFHLAADGLSLALIALTGFLGVAGVVASWREITQRVGLFHFQLLWALAGVTGVFLAADLFLLYFMWELMLVPMYFLIALWGHEDRRRAAMKFFLFTQAGGLLMLIAIASLYVAHGRQTGVYTFEYSALLGSPAALGASVWLALGFVAAFAVKLPAVPLHPWLPDAHTQAPTAGSIVLAGLLLKSGAYGFLRFVLPLFPAASAEIAPYALWAGAAGTVYGAFLAFPQRDLKRFVAYTSVSHMGYVLIGAFAGSRLALTGAALEMLCHGLGTGALFMIAGALMDRAGTRDMGRLGGLLAALPRMNAWTTAFVLASIGLPGLGNFVAEFLVLAGVFSVSPAVAAVGAAAMIASMVYGVWLLYDVFQGPAPVAGDADASRLPDLRGPEAAVLAVMTAGLVWLGVYPQPAVSAIEAGVGPPDVPVAAAPARAARTAAERAEAPAGVPGGARERAPR